VVGFLLTMNYDARNHELKIHMDIYISVLCMRKAVVSALCALTALLDLVCCTACFSVFASYSATVDIRNCC